MEPRRFEWRDAAGAHALVMAWVPGTSGDPYAFGHGPDRRWVHLAPFLIGTTPVTQALWARIMGDDPATHRDPRCPVDNVSWQRITAPGGFLDRLNASDIRPAVTGGEAAWRFRLPSEAEWEYAARGGPRWRDDFAFSGSDDPDAVAWYGSRWNRADQALVAVLGQPAGWRLANRVRKALPSRTRIRPVGAKAPNQLGLYDMSGNVWEWCEDVCIDDLAALPGDGRPSAGPGAERRLRGGCHDSWDLHCRVWWRYGSAPDAHDGCIGVRLVLAPPWAP